METRWCSLSPLMPLPVLHSTYLGSCCVVPPSGLSVSPSGAELPFPFPFPRVGHKLRCTGSVTIRMGLKTGLGDGAEEREGI